MNRTPKTMSYVLSAVFALLAAILWATPSYAAGEWTPCVQPSAETRDTSSGEIDLRQGTPLESAIVPVGVQVDQAKHSGDEHSERSPFSPHRRSPQLETLRAIDPAPVHAFVDHVSARRSPAFLMVFLN